MRFCLLAFAPVAAAELTFDSFLHQHGKSYSGSEYMERQVLFEQRLAEVQMLNARPDALWVAGINELSDLWQGELRQRLGYNKMMRHGQAADAFGGDTMMASAMAQIESFPEQWDWRDHRPAVISPVKSQGACGSCWAFAAAESIESSVALNTGKLASLSPQQLTSCTPNPQKCGGTGGCAGAIAQLAFNYTMQVGLSEIWDYPYHSGATLENGKCHDTVGIYAATITGFVQLPRNDAHALMKAVSTVGPVSISVDATKWLYYQSGIFDGCNKLQPDINHAVQLVGYGISNETKFWQVRNSWGVMWGEDGYIRLRRYDEEPCGTDITPQNGFGCEGGPASIETCGECGMLSDSAYAVGGSFGYNWDLGRRLQASSNTPFLV